VVKGSTT